MWDVTTYDYDGRKTPLNNLKGLQKNILRAVKWLTWECIEQEKDSVQTNPVTESKLFVFKSIETQLSLILENMEDN